MADQRPTYDLVLMLDPAAPEETRARILSDVEKAVRADGEIVGRHDWGQRTTAYPIAHKTEAEYHLLQMHATPALLESLQRMLRIADGLVRFRIVKLAPGTPPPPDVQAEARPEASTEGGDRESAASPASVGAPDAEPAATSVGASDAAAAVAAPAEPEPVAAPASAEEPAAEQTAAAAEPLAGEPGPAA